VSKLKDIRFRRKGNLMVARIKVGSKWLDHSDGWRTIAEAREPAIKSRDEMQAKYKESHPEPVAKPVEEKPGRNLRSLRIVAEDEADKYIKRQRLRGGDNIYSALNFFWGLIGPAADVAPRQQVKSTFAKSRTGLLDSGLLDSTIELYAKLIRDVLRLVVSHGLNADFIKELERLPKVGVREASGEPFQKSHLKVMFEREGSRSDTTRLLFWIGASGGPQIVDTVFFPLTGVNWDTGLVSYRRVKTTEKIEFAALPPLLDLLRKRRDELGPGAVYALPELIFDRFALRDPKCNRVAFDRVPKDVATRGAFNGMKEMNAFFVDCGIKSKEITHKSFRKHNISFWSSLGIKLKTRMRMSGHQRESAHYRYDVPFVDEILRAKDITWRYYQAIMDGRDFFIPTTVFDIYEGLMNHWDKFPDLVRHAMADELRGNFDSLCSLLATSFADQRALIQQQTVILQADNAQFREQLRVQAEDLKHIRAILQRLAGHVGGEA